MEFRGGNLRALKKFISSEGGAVLPIAALVFPILMGFAGLGVDASAWMLKKRNLQTAADAAALAGAWEVAFGEDEAAVDTAAEREATYNGYDPTQGGVLEATILTDDDGVQSVQVDIDQNAKVYFSSIFLDEDVTVATTATARITTTEGPFCLLSLDPDEGGAITTSGSVTIDAPGCGMAVNSGADDALALNGAVVITVGDVRTVGGVEVDGGAAEFNYASLKTNGYPVQDPYEDMAIPDFEGCSENDMRHAQDANNGDTLSPGVYCGGISVQAGADITLSPGTYILDGGGFSANGGSITGEGVTIILTNSGGSAYGSYGNIEIRGNATVYLEAPPEGEEFEGVVIFQDRDAPAAANEVNTVTGDSQIQIEGVVYTPSREFNFGGNGTGVSEQSEVCSKIIAKTIILHGNPFIGNNCDGRGTQDIGISNVVLVN